MSARTLAMLVALIGTAGGAPPAKNATSVYPHHSRPAHAGMGVIPFTGRPAPAPTPTAGLPLCRAASLRATVSLQGATGSMLGGVLLRNTGRSTCALLGPPSLELYDHAGHRLRLRALGRIALSGVRALALPPHSSAAIEIALFNACQPRPGSHLAVVLGRPTGRIELPIGAEGRCDRPSLPPGYSIGPLQHGDAASTVP
ncbi:MAG TPA: DUF4232 domain-containing protein [Gaiellaceae bacterium]